MEALFCDHGMPMFLKSTNFMFGQLLGLHSLRRSCKNKLQDLDL